MLSFLGHFSDSFVMSLLIWPLAAALLTLPVLLTQYIRFHRLPRLRVAVIYLFILYALALVMFTLYPLPDNPIQFCADYHLTPQLNPLGFIGDIWQDGLRAVLQIVLNVVFFVPLGMALRNLFGHRLRSVVIIALAVSLLIETAQLTGIFHLYPCSYRLFDVDDLLFNVSGALIGFGLARALPDLSQPDKAPSINTHPGAIHRLITFAADYLLGVILSLIIMLPLSFLDDGWQSWQPIVFAGCFVVIQLIIPLCWRGQTPIGRLTGISLDDLPRRPIWRLLFYLFRAILLGLAVLPHTVWSWILLLFVVIYYLIFRKRPYTLIDLVFGGKRRK
jgi:glycopeptide antibiotics resistance protein